MPKYVDITPKTLKAFKRLVRRKVSLSKRDKFVFQSLDDDLFRPIFREVFNGDLGLAKRVLYNMVTREDKNVPISELSKIPTLRKATVMVEDAVNSGVPMLLISDSDNDGSLSQGIGYEFQRFTESNIEVEPAEYVANVHGFSLEQIARWADRQGLSKNDEFVIITADLGTNQIAEQTAFVATYPNASLIITDHHQPLLDKTVEEDLDNSVLVNPYTVSELSERNGSVAAGGYMLHLLLRNVSNSIAKRRVSVAETEDVQKAIKHQYRLFSETIELMGEASNMLDYVQSDVRIKPLKVGDTERASDLGRTMRTGVLSQWLTQKQTSAIHDLKTASGVNVSNDVQEIQKRVYAQNFMAKALLDVIPMVIEGKPAKEIEAELIKLLANPEGYYDSVDYITKIKGRFAQLTYEQSMEAGAKGVWLQCAQGMFDQINQIGKDISNIIRKHDLLNVVVGEESVVTMAISPAIETVFSTKQLSKAYYGAEKQLNMTVSFANKTAMNLRFKSKSPIMNVLRDVQESFPEGSFNVKGHPFTGEIEVKLKSGAIFDHKNQVRLFSALDKGAIAERDLQKSVNLVEVDFFNIDAVMKVNTAMKGVVFAGEEFQIQPLIKLDKDMTLSMDYDLNRQDAGEIVSQEPWNYTSVSLDFDNKKTISLPNTAIKSVMESNFENRIRLVQTSPNSFMGVDIVTPSRMLRDRVAIIKTEKNKEQEKLVQYYKDNFGEGIVKQVSRQDMIDAITFVSNPKTPFEQHEALVLDALERTGKEAYIILDIEANDGGNAPKCFNLGLMAYTRKKDSGMLVDDAQYLSMQVSGDPISNFRKVADGYMINEQIDAKLVTTIIDEDDIALPIKIERLCNMSKPMVREIGKKSAEVERLLIEFLSQYDGYITQAHNLLGYDIDGIRANFPELYEDMLKNTFFDSKPIARDTRLVYPNIEVASVPSGRTKVLFVTTPGADYTVINKLKDTSPDNTNFTYPSFKGDKILDVRGDDVYLTDSATQVVTKVKFNRDQLLHHLIRSSGQVPTGDTKHSVEFMIKMSSIKDMLDTLSDSERVELKFDSLGFNGSDTPEMIDLWEHFQKNYDFSSSLSENLAKLSKCDQYSQADLFRSVGELDAEEQPETLQIAKQLGILSAFDKAPTKTELKKLDEGQKNITPYDILKSNALAFLSENQDAVNQYAQAWIHRLVLDHEETTAKNLEPGHIDGIARDYGLDPKVVEGVYSNTYGYKQLRGNIDSYTFHERHNNIDLSGDTYQEGVVYSHKLSEKTSNPYLSETVPELAKELNHKGMIRSTWIVQSRELLRQTFDRVRVNSYSQRQLVSFDLESRGRESFVRTESRAMLKLKNLPNGAYLKLNDVAVNEWMRFSQDDRLEIEKHVSNIVDAAMLDNGLSNIKDEDAKAIMAKLVHSDSVKESIAFVKREVGALDMSKSEPAFKDASDKIIESLLENTPYKLSINKWMNHQEIDLLVSMVDDAVTLLNDSFKVSASSEMVTDIKDVLENAGLQYDVFEHLRSHGELEPAFAEKYADVVVGPMKAQVTREKNGLKNKSSLLLEDFPELSSSLTNSKENPLGELLKTRDLGGSVEKMEFIRDFARQNMPEDYQLKMQEPALKRNM